MPKNITEELDTLLDVIVQYKMSHDGNSPSIRELLEMTRYRSTCTIALHLKRLEEMGKIQRTRQHHRIQVVGGEWRLVE